MSIIKKNNYQLLILDITPQQAYNLMGLIEQSLLTNEYSEDQQKEFMMMYDKLQQLADNTHMKEKITLYS